MAGSALQSFWEQLSSVDCVESVQQVKLGPNGKAIYKADSSFDYLVALQLTGSDIVVEESRVRSLVARHRFLRCPRLAI